jgi:hypothetical protein
MKTRVSGAAASHRNVAWMKKTPSMTESAIAQRARRAASRTGLKGYRDLQNPAKEFLDKRTQKASYAFECVMWAEMNKETVSMETEAHGPATVSMAARTNGKQLDCRTEQVTDN